MVKSLPDKLSLTMLALGCRTQKEFHNELLKANPETAFTPERAYKWAKGVAVPRDPAVFEDLAAAAGLPQGGTFYAESTLRAFGSALGAVHPLIGDKIVERTGPLPSQEAPHEDASLFAPPHYVAGSYIAISPSWSIARSDHLILGDLEIARTDASWRATYSETIGGETISYHGGLYRTGRMLFMTVVSPVSEVPLFACLQTPSSPGLVMSGIVAGAAVFDPATSPTACRAHFLRANAKAVARLRTEDGYVEAHAGALAQRLDSLGLELEDPGRLAATLFDWFDTSGDTTGNIRVTHDEVQAVAKDVYCLSQRV